MNVIVVNDNAHVNGGAAKVAIQEAVGLAQRGHRVYFVCAVAPIAPELLGSNIKVICSNQNDLLANPSRVQAFIQGWWNTKAARITKQICNEVGATDTVIHLHVWSRALSASTVRAALNSGIPLICTLHDFLLACPSATFFNHADQEVCRLRPLSQACILSNCDTRSYTQKLWRVGRQLIQIHAAHAPADIRHVIAHSGLASRVMRPYLAQDCTIHRLPIYIESSRCEPAQPEVNDSLVYVGRLVREKGVLLAALCAAAEEIPLVFVGSGPLSEEIRGRNPRAVITGWVDHATSVQHLRSARALVFPSLWYETLGLVVLEAAAHGIPAIVPDTSAAAEVVVDGVTGLHFKCGDEGDLRLRMRQLQDPDLARTLGRRAYERFWCSDYPSLDAHISSLVRIYDVVLRQQPAAHRKLATVMEVEGV